MTGELEQRGSAWLFVTLIGPGGASAFVMNLQRGQAKAPASNDVDTL